MSEYHWSHCSLQGVIVTLVLALCALQFVYDFPPASYVNVVQQLTIASFVLFGLVALGCLVVGFIMRIHERKRRYGWMMLTNNVLKAPYLILFNPMFNSGMTLFWWQPVLNLLERAAAHPMAASSPGPRPPLGAPMVPRTHPLT